MVDDDEKSAIKRAFERRQERHQIIVDGKKAQRFQKPHEAYKSAKADLKEAKVKKRLQRQNVRLAKGKDYLRYKSDAATNKVVQAAKEDLRKAKSQQRAYKKLYKRAKKRDYTLLRNKAKRTVKTTTQYKTKQGIKKVISQDETLANAIEMKRRFNQTRTVSRQVARTYDVTKATTKFAGRMGNRTYNLVRGRGFHRTPYERRLTTRARQYIQRQLARNKYVHGTAKAGGWVGKFLVKAVVNHPAVKGAGIILVLLFLLPLLLVAVTTTKVSIEQTDRQLTESWTYFTELDADHSDSSDVFYTNPDDVMFYMNYRFDDYGLHAVMNPLVHVGTYAGYMKGLWSDLNGKKPNYELKSMETLIKSKDSGYHLDKDDYDTYSAAKKNIGYQSLSNLLSFPFETENMTVSRRYGYEQSGGKKALFHSIVVTMDKNKDIKAPMEGTLSKSKDKANQVIIKSKLAQLTITGVTTNGFNDGDKVQQDAKIGVAKDTTLTIHYELYDSDQKEWYEVNPAFYFPKVTYTQQTVLSSSNFDPNADQATRASEIYYYLKKLGYSDEGIAAILGNWTIESGINPKRAEGDYLKPPVGASNSSWDDTNWLAMGGPAIYNGGYPNILHRGLGLGQWTDTSDGGRRHTMLLDYANQQKKKWYDLQLQLDFLLNADAPGAQTAVKTILKNDKHASVPDLTQQFLNRWEGASVDKLAQRTQSAMDWYNFFKSGGTNDADQQKLINDVNAYRAKQGLPPVTYDPKLAAIAKSRAQLGVNNVNSGASGEGIVPPNHFQTMGEVVAWQWQVNQVVDAWYNETNMMTVGGVPGHRLWIIDPKAKRVGFAIIQAKLQPYIVGESNVGHE
jgi:uncharacterized protein YkwD